MIEEWLNRTHVDVLSVSGNIKENYSGNGSVSAAGAVSCAAGLRQFWCW
jgi:hypothetical protein